MNVLLLDLDDTLVDDTRASRESVEQVLTSVDLIADNGALDQAWSHIRKLWSRHPHRHTGPLTTVSGWEALWLLTTGSGLPLEVTDSLHEHQIRVWRTIIESLGGNPAQASTAASTFQACRRRAVRLLPGVEAGLKSLGSNHALWVATNGLPAQQRMKITATGLDPILDQVLISGELASTKADPGFAAAIRRSLQQNGQRVCLVVGDSATQDLQLAGNGGWQAAHICPQGACAPELPRGVVVTHAPSLAQVTVQCGC
ncbi:HAD family hydrolase [Micromonospora arborensis]|uniref:HAD family hydrolase n=1 Tax=Micromonospora arborensis TaxID=2116518 RepID=UPI0033FF94BB